MTKTELSRTICSRLEPNPIFTDAGPCYVLGVVLPSNLGFWTIKNEPDAVPEPVNFFEDEGASARLRRAMPDPILFRYADGWGCCHKCTMNNWYMDASKHEDDKTAIALEAQRWLKIEGEINNL